MLRCFHYMWYLCIAHLVKAKIWQDELFWLIGNKTHGKQVANYSDLSVTSRELSHSNYLMTSLNHVVPEWCCRIPMFRIYVKWQTPVITLSFLPVVSTLVLCASSFLLNILHLILSDKWGDITHQRVFQQHLRKGRGKFFLLSQWVFLPFDEQMQNSMIITNREWKTFGVDNNTNQGGGPKGSFFVCCMHQTAFSVWHSDP